MATYYKYKDKTAEEIQKSSIDWGGLTKTISDNLQKENIRRKELKFSLEEDHIKQLNELNKYEQGLDPNANEFMMKQAQQSRDWLLENHKLMKNGLISVNDAKLKKQNVTNTWNNINETQKTFNTTYSALVDSGTAGDFALAEDLANAADFKNKKIYYSESGEGFFTEKLPNGDKNYIPVRSLNNPQMKAWETANVIEDIAKYEKGIGTWIEALSAYESIENLRDNPEFDKWKINTTNAIKGSARKQSSVLTDYLKTHKLEENYSGDDPNIIKMVRDNNGILQPELTPEQEKAVDEAIGTAIEMTIDKKWVKSSRPQGRQRTGDEDKKYSIAGLIDKFVLSNDINALNSALSQTGFSGSLAPDEKGIIRLRKDGELKEINTKGQTARQVGQLIAGHLDVADAYNKKSKAGNSALNEGVLNPSNADQYITFISRETVSKASSDALSTAIKGDKDAFSDFRPNPVEVKGAVQNSAKEIGLSSEKIELINNILYYVPGGSMSNIEIGVIGSSTASDIIGKLQEIQSETTTTTTGGVPINPSN